MTRVVVLPADETACGYYRMKLPAGAVGSVRPDWKIEVYRPSNIHLAGDPYTGKLWGINGLPDPNGIDLLIMQRVGTPLQLSLLRWARDNGIATVLDVDDAMWCIDKDNTAYSSWNSEGTHWRFLDRASEIVDLTTVTTPYLARRYDRKGRTEILPNCVPAEVPGGPGVESLLEPLRDSLDPSFAIGWAGFTHTHPRDLEVVGDAVQRFVDETGAKVRIIGDAEGAARAWGIKEVDWVKPVPVGLPYYTALTSLDLGLAPLEENNFNRGKSYLKALEFSSVGIPVVASPTPANRELAKTVPISIASDPDQWFEYILRIYEEDHRGLGLSAQEKVFKNHTYEGNAELWAQAWERAMARRRRLAV